MSDPCLIYRVQASDGRGPYRDRLSLIWADAEGPTHPTIMDEFGIDWVGEIPGGCVGGCGFRTPDQAAHWFSENEAIRLELLGFRFVGLRGCRVIRESERQVIFWRPIPLNKSVIRVTWPARPPGSSGVLSIRRQHNRNGGINERFRR